MPAVGRKLVDNLWVVRYGTYRAPTVPGVPRIVAVVNGDGQSTVSWSAPQNGRSAITEYRVTKNGVAVSPNPGASATSLALTGLTNGTTYTIGVSAINAIGTGPEALTLAKPVAPASVGTQPSRESSNIPNGTHWFGKIPTPWYNDSTVYTVEVDCTWAAISAAVAAMTATQVNAGARILVRPGTLTGVATGSNNLSNRGNEAWTKRLLIRPRDGYGSVVCTGTTRFSKMHRVAWAGFPMEYLRWNDSQGVGIARCDISNLLGQDQNESYARGGSKTELIEVVVAKNGRASNADTVQLQCWYDSSDYVIDGCFFGPTFLNTAGGHSDTCQFEGHAPGPATAPTGPTARFLNTLLRDSTLMGSQNTALQDNGLYGYTSDNVLYVGQAFHDQRGSGRYNSTSWPNTILSNASWCINGQGKNRIFTNSKLIGAIGVNQEGWTAPDKPFITVTGTSIKTDPAANMDPTNGSWTVVSGMVDNPAAPPIPSDAYLTDVWT